ncbi:MAG TPA: dihydrodipicolinate reductase [Vicinamibacteria bacterium]|nr:dihydrodipicolinate reductase [Vicinamibacteria bacterium]
MARTLKVAVAGLGPVGQSLARLLLHTPGVKLVAAVDSASVRTGQDLGTVLGLGRRLQVKVGAEPEGLLRRGRPDVAFVCSSSLLKDVRSTILSLVGRRVHVLTSCEELAYPVPQHLSAFREIDRLARARKVAVLATGVNPGFAMDVLVLALSAPCATVRRVAVTRVIDAGLRGLATQRGVGAGLNLGQFRRAVTEGNVRHVGLAQSAHMIAGALGWKLDRLDETLEPAIAPRDLDTAYLRIPAGAAAGIRQCARAYRGDQLAISLDLQAYVGAESPRDHVLIDGDPPVDASVAGGVNGDAATAALLVNSLPRLLASPPGLRSAAELPLVHALNPQQLAAVLQRRR